MVLAQIDLVSLDRITQVIRLGMAFLQLMQVLQAVDRDGEDGTGGEQLCLVLHLQ